MKRITALLTLFLAMTFVSCKSGKTVGENPFFSAWETPYGVPPFDKILPEHFMPAFERGMSLHEALSGLQKVPQRTVNVRLDGASAKAVVGAGGVVQALQAAQAAVQGRGRAFLRPSGTEPVVRVTVEADDDALMQATLDALAAAVRAAA